MERYANDASLLSLENIGNFLGESKLKDGTSGLALLGKKVPVKKYGM